MGNGRRVRAIVTDRGTLARHHRDAPWRLVALAPGESTPGDAVEWFRAVGFEIDDVTARSSPAITAAERAALAATSRIDGADLAHRAEGA
jgi:hypothetical protein